MKESANQNANGVDKNKQKTTQTCSPSRKNQAAKQEENF